MSYQRAAAKIAAAHRDALDALDRGDSDGVALRNAASRRSAILAAAMRARPGPEDSRRRHPSVVDHGETPA